MGGESPAGVGRALAPERAGCRVGAQADGGRRLPRDRGPGRPDPEEQVRRPPQGSGVPVRARLIRSLRLGRAEVRGVRVLRGGVSRPWVLALFFFVPASRGVVRSSVAARKRKYRFSALRCGKVPANTRTTRMALEEVIVLSKLADRHVRGAKACGAQAGAEPILTRSGR